MGNDSVGLVAFSIEIILGINDTFKLVKFINFPTTYDFSPFKIKHFKITNFSNFSW